MVASTPKVMVPRDLGRVVWLLLAWKLVHHLLLWSIQIQGQKESPPFIRRGVAEVT